MCQHLILIQTLILPIPTHMFKKDFPQLLEPVVCLLANYLMNNWMDLREPFLYNMRFIWEKYIYSLMV